MVLKLHVSSLGSSAQINLTFVRWIPAPISSSVRAKWPGDSKIFARFCWFKWPEIPHPQGGPEFLFQVFWGTWNRCTLWGTRNFEQFQKDVSTNSVVTTWVFWHKRLNHFFVWLFGVRAGQDFDKIEKLVFCRIFNRAVEKTPCCLGIA